MSSISLISPNPKFMSLDANGDPHVGAKLYTYETGTTTPKTTWTDYTKSASNTNPVILDSKGQADVWIDSSGGAYRFKLTDSDDVVLWTVDNVQMDEGNLAIGPQLSAAYALASGTDTYTASMGTAITSYATGDHYFITFPNTNTATNPTLDIDGVGAKTIKDVEGGALDVGSIGNDHAAILKYDGTYLLLLNPITVSDIAYAASWNGVDGVAPSKNAVRDMVVSLGIGETNIKMWFYQNTAPTGWTIDATPEDALLAVKGGSDAYNVDGGNQAGTWTQPNHTHTYNTVIAHTHPYLSKPFTGGYGAGTGSGVTSTGSDSKTTTSTGSASGTTAGGATAATYRPLAQVGIICTKD